MHCTYLELFSLYLEKTLQSFESYYFVATITFLSHAGRKAGKSLTMSDKQQGWNGYLGSTRGYGYLLLNTRPERVGYKVSCGTCQSQRQYRLIRSLTHDKNAKKFFGHGKFGVVEDIYSKPLFLWITSLVMQCFLVEFYVDPNPT